MKDTRKLVKSMSYCAVMVLSGILLVSTVAQAGVSAQEAEQLKTTLMPLGGEKAGNKDGTIPGWTGGATTVPKGYVPNKTKKRPDLFPDEKPLFKITAGNMSKYADKLSEGDKALLKKYPEYYINVYPTHRTAAAPEWVYDNTLKNATRGKMTGDLPVNVYGGIPFPIPKTGLEAIWNHILAFNGGALDGPLSYYIVTADGKHSLLSKTGIVTVRNSYYIKGGSPEKWDGYYKKVILTMTGPPVRAGEGVLAWGNADSSKDGGWSYFPGQRRVRQLPSPCCDTPNPSFSGMANFDEVNNWNGRTDNYDWKIVGKKEMYIPYNENRWSHAPNDDASITGHVANPEFRRYELHRVWMVEGTLKRGKRNVYPRVVVNLDEDTWQGVSAERYDANGKLWKVSSIMMITAPEVPVATSSANTAIYDLMANTAFITSCSESPYDIKFLDMKSLPVSRFTPEALSTLGVR